MRDVLLQPFRSNKYKSLKAILIERRGLTTPERVNKVISGERIGTDIPSRFWRLNPTVPPSKVWPFLADRALAAEEDVEESKPGVAEIKVEKTTKLVGLLEDLSRRI